MKFKVDYSTEAKHNFKYGMKGLFALYYRKHWWNRWEEVKTFDSTHRAFLVLEQYEIDRGIYNLCKI